MENKNYDTSANIEENNGNRREKRDRIIIIGLAILLLVAIILSLFFGISNAISGGGPGDQSASKLRLKINSEDNVTQIDRGETLQLGVTIIDHETDEELNHEITWEALHPEIATIDANGLLTSILHGNATFKAISNEDIKLFDTFTVSILADTSVAITSLDNVASIYEDETLQLYAAVTQHDGSPVSQTVVWESDNRAIASIDANGLVRAHHYGEVNLRATTINGTYAFATFALEVKPLTMIEISSYDDVNHIVEGEELQLNVMVWRTDEQAVSQAVTWESSDPTIATINEQGLVSSNEPGQVILSVTATAAPNVSDTFTLTIIPQTKVRIITAGNVDNILAGETLDFFASVSKENDPNISQQVLWSTSDPEIAQIDNTGHLVSKTPGEVIIKAEAMDGSQAYDTFELHIGAKTIVQISTPNNVTTLIEGQTLQLSVLVSKVGDPDVSQDVDWGVNTFTLASITNDGLLTAAHYGEVTVVATTTDGSAANDYLTIHIEAITTVEVSSVNDVNNIQEESTLELSAVINKDDDPEIAQDVVWHSSDNTIATVDQNGLVTAHSYGDVTIVATQIGGQGAQGEFALHIDAHVVITIAGDNPRIIYMGENTSLNAIVSAPDGRPVSQAVTWSTSNDQIATVSNTGIVRGVNLGETSITVISADGLIGVGNEVAKATINIRVVEPRNGIIYRETPDGSGQIVVGLIPNLFNPNLVIPAVFDGKPVVEIGQKAFSGEDTLISCIIPDSVTTLGFGAFNIGILNNVFTTCVIGDGVTEISNSCFMAASKLVNITFGSKVAIINDNAFQYCYNLEEIILPESIVWIKNSAFVNCTSLRLVILPRSLEHLGSSVFAYCPALTEIYMPATILITGCYIFSDTPVVINCEPLSKPDGWGSEGKTASNTWDGSAYYTHTINWGVPPPGIV